MSNMIATTCPDILFEGHYSFVRSATTLRL